MNLSSRLNKMASNGNSKQTNNVWNNPIPASVKSNNLQINNHSATRPGNQSPNHQTNVPKESQDNPANKENIQMRDLQDKIAKMEEEVVQYKKQIKDLENKVMSK